MEPVVVCEYQQAVDLVAPRRLWREVNLFNIGRETVPLDEEWPEGKHGSMLKVHNMLACTHRRTITVQVMSDGNLRIKLPEKQ